jgi:diaminopimelate decarboxylase
MNDLVRPAMYDAFHRIWPAQPRVAPPQDYEGAVPNCEPVDIVGPICESSDYLAKDRYLPAVKRDDYLVTFSAGAYGTAMSSNYNTRPRGAEIMVDGTTVSLIRRRETYADLVAHEKL